MNRADLQTIAETRVREAKILLDNGEFAGAYYLFGYAVECALKSAIAKQIKEHDFPDKKLVTDSYTHDLDRLLSLSGLRIDFNKETAANPAFNINWGVVKDWSEDARYEASFSEKLVRDFFQAVLDESAGVLQWLKKRW